ncbi:hypothetical protein IDAT_09370 [Pseudidiomarina atlantica]|jgi:bis(5'-nucleosyl)-tetraphosphatase (symmetrical)|uniref:bis(5'-nucleosyl)-tetraphosphatase (symmetrical) n=1 Tax=Pseudidiomarina atlantica TaxID=1517416 RepID=A0A094J7C3_9GAMM|nr:symmetrical bis(5'-nucleosyl)-tetraphosphatase [Pseudidiomarina atlantica]KFZ28506.1 hypothetical protein IDAT_09370 [Pseudidiomarina atlantica]
MARYLVGDLQGCVQQLAQLLEHVQFNPARDELWCVGDLVARGPDSLQCLELCRSLGPAFKAVLGNHDLNLMAVLLGVRRANPKDRLDEILALPEADKQQWLEFLINVPLMRTSDDLVMSHAGIYPYWNIAEAQSYADEVSASLRTAYARQELADWLREMYGNEPACWSDTLTGAARIRFFINAFTRMRFLNANGCLNLNVKEQPSAALREQGLTPWFEAWPQTANTVVFGHWAALQGQTARADVIGLDTGCVWGEYMTLMRWPDGQRWQAANPAR